MESLEIKIGKRYFRRDGKRTGVLESISGSSRTHAYYDPDHQCYYTERGCYYSDESQAGGDLVEEYFETGPIPPDSTEDTGLKYDKGKLLFSCLTRGLAVPLRAIAAVLTYGAMKYKRDSWQTVPNARERYEDALDRHLNAWKSGEKYDSESGLLHIAHAACNTLFLVWFEITQAPPQEYVNVTEFNDPTKEVKHE